MKGIVICFPGTGYHFERPVFHACIEKFSLIGYRIFKISYGNISFDDISCLEDAAQAILPGVGAQLKEIDFGLYDDVVLLSKSLGTFVAATMAKKLHLPARHILLTPLPETLDLLPFGDTVSSVVAGELDQLADCALTETFCTQRQIPFLIIPGVGHSLEHKDCPAANRDIAGKVAAFCCPA